VCARWARTFDRHKATQPLRDGLRRKFERLTLEEAERQGLTLTPEQLEVGIEAQRRLYIAKATAARMEKRAARRKAQAQP
jgi:hypothetical protein